MHARVTTIWLPPSRLDEAVRFIREEVVPAMAQQPGLYAIWLLADRPAGTLLSIGLWDTVEHLAATDFLYQELRAKVGSLFGGPPIDEPYEARPPEQGIYAVRYQPARPPAPAAAQVARVTSAQGEPGRVEDVVRQLEAQVAPVLERLSGYRGLYLLVDAAAGIVRSVALWDSRAALTDSDAAVAPLRAQTAETLGAGAAPSVAVYDVAAHHQA
jgi:hypothetical protein